MRTGNLVTARQAAGDPHVDGCGEPATVPRPLRGVADLGRRALPTSVRSAEPASAQNCP